MTTAVSVYPSAEIQGIIDFRREAHYWRSRHDYVAERLEVWKQKAIALEKDLRAGEVLLEELRRQREADKARIAWLEKQVFGQKTEQGGVPSSEAGGEGPKPDNTEGAGQKKRGQQAGMAGHGRRRRAGLAIEVVEHDLAAEKQFCPRCGLALNPFPGTEDSEEIHWEVRLVRRIYRRKRYRPTCACQALPGIVTAPGPVKLIRKGLFSTGFWVRLLMEKYLFQRPLNRVLQVLSLEGLQVSAGTLTGGLQQIAPLMGPVYEAIKIHSLRASRRKMDETRWPVFVHQPGKKGYRWWMWIDVTAQTVVYLLDPTRSAAVLKDHLGDWEGILLADCYAAYKTYQAQLGQRGLTLILAFCWAHRRRDVVEVRDGYPRLGPWAESWIDAINEVFRLNDRRVEALSNPAAFAVWDHRLRQALAAMVARRDQELADPSLHPAARQALMCQRRHWQGLTVFVDHPEIPMDNNESERLQRSEAIGRKNYYGSGSLWGGALRAQAFTIFQTLLRNQIDPQQWFPAYFTACAQNGGLLPNVETWLPWNLSAEQKQQWLYPQGAP